MKKIKVLHFVPGLGSGGIGVLMLEWYKRKADSVEFEIATIGKGMIYDELTTLGCRIYDFEPIRNVGFIKYIRNAYKLIKKNDYDIIHSHVGMVSCFIFLAAILARKKRRILHAHATRYNRENGKPINTAVSKILKTLSVVMATDYLACSNNAAEYLFGKTKANKSAVVIKNGIDLSRFKYQERENSAQKTIGYVARFEESKNHIFLLQVFSEVLKTYEKSVELLLIGAGDHSKITEIAGEEGVLDCIRILPPQKQIEIYYGLMDVFAFPSVTEGLGLVAIEAQACGIPTIVSPGVPDEAMVSSLAVKVDLDAGLWAQTIVKLLDCSHPEDVHEQIISSGYDIVTSTKSLMEVYLGDF